MGFTTIFHFMLGMGGGGGSTEDAALCLCDIEFNPVLRVYPRMRPKLNVRLARLAPVLQISEIVTTPPCDC